MSAEDNKKVLHHIFEEALTKHQLDLLDEHYTADYEFDAVAVAGVDPANQGLEGFKKRVLGVRAAFPDAQFIIEDIAAQGDLVATNFLLRGTHKSDFAGFAPTNRLSNLKGIHLSYLVDGKIKKTWAGFVNVAEELRP